MAWTERYVRADADGTGNGTTDANSGVNGAWTITQAMTPVTGAVAGHRVNVKAGSYALGASLTASEAGPIWWRGFNSAIGDLDDATVSTNFPAWNFAGNFFVTAGGAAHIWQNIKVSSANTTAARGAMYVTGARNVFRKCDFSGTANDADAVALYLSGTSDGSSAQGCSFTSHATAASVINLASSASFNIRDSVLSGGVLGMTLGSSCTVLNCLITGCSSHGITSTAGDQIVVDRSIFYSIGGDAIRCTHASIMAYMITNNIFSAITGYAIKSSGFAGAAANYIDSNLYHNINSGGARLNQIYESQEYNAYTDASSPFISAGTDYHLLSTSAGKTKARPQQWLGLGSGGAGYGDIGALQPQSSGGGRSQRLSVIQ